jgi:dihydrolipoamide dehydrogenase
MSERIFDVVVIGAGPAGEVAAGRLGEAGLKVALVEERLVGGECSFWACMPSKALLRPAQALAEARRVPGAAEAITGELDVEAVLHRRDEVIHDLDDSSQLPWLEERGIALVRGHGRLDGERRVRVGDDVLVAERGVIVATGSRPSLPPVEGLEAAHPWTNREATTAKQVPARLAILGGGVVGVEMAQAYASLGSAVTVLEPGDRLIRREEEFASRDVQEGLERDGVKILCGTRATKVERRDAVRIETDRAGPIEADEILVAAGRTPGTEDLGVEVLGIEPGQPIEVDDTLRPAGHPWLYVVGDVNGRQLLTHMGKYQARVAADQLLGKGTRVRDSNTPPPRVIFTEPQVAAVGYTLASAREAGLEARAVDAPTSSTAGASFYGRGAPGTCRLVVDAGRDVVIGATFTGVDVAEWVHAATIAVSAGVTVEDLWHAIPCFPTRSEVWLKLTEKLEEAA